MPRLPFITAVLVKVRRIGMMKTRSGRQPKKGIRDRTIAPLRRPEMSVLAVSGATWARKYFSVPEGKVAMHWPTILSSASIEDLQAWLDLIKRKIGAPNLKDKETEESAWQWSLSPNWGVVGFRVCCQRHRRVTVFVHYATVIISLGLCQRDGFPTYPTGHSCNLVVHLSTF